MRTRPCTTSYYLALPDITLHLLDMSYNHIACKLHRTGRCTLKLTWNEYQNGKTKSGRGSVRKTWTEWMWVHYVDTWRLDVCRTSINYRVRGIQTLFFRRFVRGSSRCQLLALCQQVCACPRGRQNWTLSSAASQTTRWTAFQE